MSGIGKLMQRLGYVKLERYGLLMTPEDRIIATRPTILDDGGGGRVVGWRDGDLAAMELTHWAPTPIATPRRRARITATPRVPTPVAAATPVASARPLPGLVPYIPPTPVVTTSPIEAAPVDDSPELTEDEWEWEIAVARARAAAAEEVELAARVIPIASRMPLQARSKPQLVAAAPPEPRPKFVAQEPKTLPGIAPFVAFDDAAVTEVGDDTQLTSPRAPVAAPRASSPRTIIPVPKLPSHASATRAMGEASWIPPPVVRNTQPVPVVPRRTAKGTGPVVDRVNSEQTSPMIELRDTPAPKLRMVSPTPLPSIKQRMATRG